jgi:hypothetical protein
MKLTNEQIEQAVANSKASHAIEGLQLSHEAESLVASRLQKEIPHSEFIRAAKEMAKRG